MNSHAHRLQRVLSAAIVLSASAGLLVNPTPHPASSRDTTHAVA